MPRPAWRAITRSTARVRSRRIEGERPITMTSMSESSRPSRQRSSPRAAEPATTTPSTSRWQGSVRRSATNSVHPQPGPPRSSARSPIRPPLRRSPPARAARRSEEKRPTGGPRSLPEPLPQLGVVEQQGDRPQQGSRVLGLNQEAADAVLDDLGQAACRRGDHRPPPGHRLQGDGRAGVGPDGGDDQQEGVAVEAGELGLRALPQVADRLGGAASRRRRPDSDRCPGHGGCETPPAAPGVPCAGPPGRRRGSTASRPRGQAAQRSRPPGAGR